jgi:hypothetical protein
VAGGEAGAGGGGDGGGAGGGVARLSITIFTLTLLSKILPDGTVPVHHRILL